MKEIWISGSEVKTGSPCKLPTNVRDIKDGKTVMVVKFTPFEGMSDNELSKLQTVGKDYDGSKERSI